ncbi:MAG: hypothetical protein PW792_04305 [Acidobacteriaceae bacterium]|nr:hypothetical protein [Acidobacteriaceae bacterium]
MKPAKLISSTFLAALMLVISCISAKCEVVCDFRAMGMACHGQQAAAKAEPQSSMPSMKDCGMGRRSAAVPDQAHAIHTQCAHQVCKEDVALIQSEKQFKVSLASLQAVAIVAVFSLDHGRVAEPMLLARSETPPLRSISPLESGSVLRV